MKTGKKTNPAKFWILVWLLGLAGQLCWNIENQWFNTFVYAKIAKDPTIISWMLAISALATAGYRNHCRNCAWRTTLFHLMYTSLTLVIS